MKTLNTSALSSMNTKLYFFPENEGSKTSNPVGVALLDSCHISILWKPSIIECLTIQEVWVTKSIQYFVTQEREGFATPWSHFATGTVWNYRFATLQHTLCMKNVNRIKLSLFYMICTEYNWMSLQLCLFPYVQYHFCVVGVNVKLTMMNVHG